MKRSGNKVRTQQHGLGAVNVFRQLLADCNSLNDQARKAQSAEKFTEAIQLFKACLQKIAQAQSCQGQYQTRPCLGETYAKNLNALWQCYILLGDPLAGVNMLKAEVQAGRRCASLYLMGYYQSTSAEDHDVLETFKENKNFYKYLNQIDVDDVYTLKDKKMISILKARQYRFGHGGVAVNMPLAIEYYKKSTEYGFPQAAYELSIIFVQQLETVNEDKKQQVFAEIKKYIVIACMSQEPVPVAMHNYAAFNDEGLYGFSRKPAVALQWYKKAADLGLAASQHNYGWKLCQGEDVAQNFKEGLPYLERAANQGHLLAKIQLASYYLEGISCDDTEDPQTIIEKGIAQYKALIYDYKVSDPIVLHNLASHYLNTAIDDPIKMSEAITLFQTASLGGMLSQLTI